MNILYLTNKVNTGGITSYVYTLAAGMKERSHRVYLASSGGEHLEKFKRQGIIFFPVPMNTKKEINFKIMLTSWKLSKIIREHDIEIVHSHSRTTQVLGCLLHRQTGCHHISTCHGFFKNRVLRRVFPCWGEAVIAISASVKEHLIKDFKLKDENILVINNGIDVQKFQTQELKSRAGIKKYLGLGDGPVIGIVARLSDVKGHIYLIKAMQEVLKKFPLAQLLIVGEGKMGEALRGMVKSLGIGKNVFFIPRVTDTRDVLSVMDVFVMPSLAEGLGLALMEAMAMGLACIGSDVGGIKSLIKHRQNGLLVSPQDPEQLREAIEELLGNEQERKLYGANAKIYIANNFNQEKMLRQTEEVYTRCLSATGY